jgi:phytoene/squalene synthetase
MKEKFNRENVKIYYNKLRKFIKKVDDDIDFKLTPAMKKVAYKAIINEKNHHFQYAAQQLKHADHPTYISILLTRHEFHEALYALYTFHIELSRIPLIASDDAVGKIRLYWWKEMINDIYKSGKVKNQPVLKALAETIRRHRLPKKYFSEIIKYRQHDLEEKHFKTFAELESYIEKTSGNIIRLALLVMDVEMTHYLEREIKHLSYALKALNIIESLKHRNFNQHPFVPEELIGKLQSANSVEKSEEVVKLLYQYAQKNLRVIGNGKSLEEVKLLKLQKIAADYRLQNIRKNKFRIFDTPLYNKAPLLLMLKMLFSSIR